MAGVAIPTAMAKKVSFWDIDLIMAFLTFVQVAMLSRLFNKGMRPVPRVKQAMYTIGY
jgi:hypothetical protein